MASIWKLNGADIYVDQFASSIEPTIAELNPIDSTNSVYHFIFTPDDTIDIEAIVIGSGHIATLENGVGDSVTLITDLDLDGVTVLFKNFKYNRIHTICQTVDTTQESTAPVYKVTCTLRK